MIFNKHLDLVGKHAFLSPSKYHWINYDEEKIVDSYDNYMTAARGSRLHALAKDLIDLGIKLPNTMQTLNMYVNDCIGFRMKTEVPLMYTYNAYGTCDSISFGERLLRIFDLKNGVTPTKETQLEIYAAFFCLEYKVRPAEIEYDLRIYQNDDIYQFDTDPDRIAHIIDRVVEFDKLIERMKEV